MITYLLITVTVGFAISAFDYWAQRTRTHCLIATLESRLDLHQAIISTQQDNLERLTSLVALDRLAQETPMPVYVPSTYTYTPGSQFGTKVPNK